MSAGSAEPTAGDPTFLAVHLAGSARGQVLAIRGPRVRIGVDPDAELPLPDDLEPSPGRHHATLRRRGGTYEIEAEPGHEVWVNAEPVDRMTLASGDVIELGRDGAVLRFRIYPPGHGLYRPVHDLFADCIECSRRGAGTRLGRLALASRLLPRDLLRGTSPVFRIAWIAALLGLSGATWALTARTRALEESVARAIDGVEAGRLLEASEAASLNDGALAELLGSLEAGLAAASSRLDSIEGASVRRGRSVRAAASATIFLLGSYGFRDPASGELLRLVAGPAGRPLTRPGGGPRLTLGGRGPPLERLYTGTGWVASAGGLVVTNRHVALPWEADEAAQSFIARGLEPVMHRFIGYLPGEAEPFDVELVRAADDADLAVLRCSIEGEVPFLETAVALPDPGEPVTVLGYPLGIRALMARAGTEFVSGIRARGEPDFWTVAGELARRGLIAPIATRGIVGQRTPEFITYDAETTGGGSGGPVILDDGRVVAVNTAILPEFGGSNLGVPAIRAAALLRGGDPSRAR